MKALKYATRTALLGIGLLFFSGCGHKQQSFTVKIFVDGSDIVKASDNRLWIEHEIGSLPGKTIYVNGQAWTPRWNDKTSTIFKGLIPAFRPRDDQKIQVTKLAGRGKVSIAEFPSPDNDQTLSIRIDDNVPPGADWYDVQVSLFSFGALGFLTFNNPQVIINGIVALTMIGISLPLVKRKIKRNRWYGIRCRETYKSEERWLEINEYGGRLLLFYGIALAIMAGIGVVLKREYWDGYSGWSFWVIVGGLAIVLVLIFRYIAKTKKA